LGARRAPRPYLEFSRMMILRSSPPSPFGRKVKIAAALLGLDKEITIEKTDTTDASDTIRKQNPLGKIPALILEDGSVLHDSPVILDYLDHRAGGAKIIPSEPNARYAALTLQSLCDGVLDACLLQVYEGRWRPAEKHEKKWVDYQAEKVNAKFFIVGPADVLKRYEREVEKAPFRRIKAKYSFRSYDELQEMFESTTRYREVSDHFLG